MGWQQYEIDGMSDVELLRALVLSDGVGVSSSRVGGSDLLRARFSLDPMESQSAVEERAMEYFGLLKRR
jgi:hypothetical protein